MSDIVEQGAIITGIGISRVGRKTGIAGLELTAESSAEAIADAGLTPSDIDGIATMGRPLSLRRRPTSGSSTHGRDHQSVDGGFSVPS